MSQRQVGALARSSWAWFLVTLAAIGGLALIEREWLPAMADQLGGVNAVLALVALLVLISVEFAKAFRWYVLYGTLRPSYRTVLQARVLSQVANSLAPVRVGEPVAVLWASPRGSALLRGSVGLALTKAIDAVVLVALLAWLVGPSAPAIGVLWPAALIVGLLALAAARLKYSRRESLYVRARVQQLLGWVGEYARELDASAVALVVGTSAVVWILAGLANAAVLAAFGLPPSIDLSMRMLVGGYVAALLPSPPAQLGVLDAALAGALMSGGVPVDAAITAAVLMHALQLAQIAILALGTTRRQRVR